MLSQKIHLFKCRYVLKLIWCTLHHQKAIRKTTTFQNDQNPVNTLNHELINFIDTKAKCRHIKNWPVKGLCGRCVSEFIDWRYSQSWWYFRPSFLNCCPSNLLSGSTLPPPLPCVNKNTVYTYTVCRGRGVSGSGSHCLRQINNCKKSLYRSIFLDYDILYCLLWVLSFYAWNLHYSWRRYLSSFSNMKKTQLAPYLSGFSKVMPNKEQNPHFRGILPSSKPLLKSI